MTEALTIISYNGYNINDGILYEAYFPSDSTSILLGTANTPVVEADRVEAHPTTAGLSRNGRSFAVEVLILTGDRQTLAQLFDPENGTVSVLECLSEATGETVVVYVTCESLHDVADTEALTLRASLRTNGDVYWRRKNQTGVIWPVNGGNVTASLDNFGDMDAYPELTFTPNAPKSGDFSYREFIEVRNNAPGAVSNYPVDIVSGGWDSATLIGGGKLQADARDLRVVVDGVNFPYILSGLNTASTKIWVPLNMQVGVITVLEDGFLAGDTVETIELEAGLIANMPNAGMVRIDNEVFTYTDKNTAENRLLGVTRADKNTAAADHVTGVNVYLISRNIEIIYGNPAAVAPVYDWEPAFDIAASTNTIWVYNGEFGTENALWSGQWQFSNFANTIRYTAPLVANADPWTAVGMKTGTSGAAAPSATGAFELYRADGVASFSVTTGARASTTTGTFTDIDNILHVIYRGINVYQFDSPVWAGSSWTYSGSAQDGAVTCGITLNYVRPDNNPWLETASFDIQACSVTGANPSTTWRTGEVGNYLLNATVINENTGESIVITYTMQVGDSLEVDTDNYSIIDKANGSKQLQALQLVQGARQKWLRLIPGVNTLRFIDDNTTDVSLMILYEPRYYL